MGKLKRKQPDKKKSSWKLGDPIPDKVPTVKLSMSLDAKIWGGEPAKGLSVGPGQMIEFTLPFSELERYKIEMSSILLEMAEARLNEAVQQLSDGMSKIYG